MTNKTITCTECPNGCQIQAELDGEKIKGLYGFLCPRGQTYALNELTDPRRVVTSTVKTTTGGVIPVKTAKPVKKKNIFAVMEKINALVVAPPVKIGEVLMENIDEDISLIATGNAEK